MTVKIIPKRFIHYVKKKQALRVEPLPELEERVIYKRYRQSYSTCKGKVTCVICGLEARFVAYFEAHGCQLVEKYCKEHLDKYVICKVTLQPLPPNNE